MACPRAHKHGCLTQFQCILPHTQRYYGLQPDSDPPSMRASLDFCDIGRVCSDQVCAFFVQGVPDLQCFDAGTVTERAKERFTLLFHSALESLASS